MEGLSNIGIVLRNHNAYELTSDCLNALKKTSYKLKDFCVINDGCTDNSPKQLKEQFPDVHFINSSKYIEYSKGLNLGIRYFLMRGHVYIFIINNDTKNFSKHYFEELLKPFSDPKMGMTGSSVYNYDGLPLWTGKAKNKLGVSMETPTEGYLIKSALLREIGLLSERYTRYFEDLDFILRLRRAGFKTASCPKVSFEHLCHGTSSKQVFIPNFYRSRNFWWFIKKECKTQSLAWVAKRWVAYFTYHISKFKYWTDQNKFHKAALAIGSYLLGNIVGLLTAFDQENQETFNTGT